LNGINQHLFFADDVDSVGGNTIKRNKLPFSQASRTLV